MAAAVASRVAAGWHSWQAVRAVGAKLGSGGGLRNDEARSDRLEDTG
jgi:hypothetical protein